MYFDTALIQGTEAEDYTGLMGVYLGMGDDTHGYYQIKVDLILERYFNMIKFQEKVKNKPEK